MIYFFPKEINITPHNLVSNIFMNLILPTIRPVRIKYIDKLCPTPSMQLYDWICSNPRPNHMIFKDRKNWFTIPGLMTICTLRKIKNNYPYLLQDCKEYENYLFDGRFFDDIPRDLNFSIHRWNKYIITHVPDLSVARFVSEWIKDMSQPMKDNLIRDLFFTWKRKIYFVGLKTFIEIIKIFGSTLQEFIPQLENQYTNELHLQAKLIALSSVDNSSHSSPNFHEECDEEGFDYEEEIFHMNFHPKTIEFQGT